MVDLSTFFAMRCAYFIKQFPCQAAIFFLTYLSIDPVTSQEALPDEVYQPRTAQPVLFSSREMPEVLRPKAQVLNKVLGDRIAQFMYYGEYSPLLRGEVWPIQERYDDLRSKLLINSPQPSIVLRPDKAYYGYNMHDTSRKRVVVTEGPSSVLPARFPEDYMFPVPDYDSSDVHPFVALGQQASLEVPVVVAGIQVSNAQDGVTTLDAPEHKLFPTEYIPREVPSLRALESDVTSPPREKYVHDPLPSLPELSILSVEAANKILQQLYDHDGGVIFNGDSPGSSFEEEIQLTESPDDLDQEFESLEFLSLPRKLQEDIKLIKDFLHNSVSGGKDFNR